MDWRGAVIYGAPGESRTLDLFVRNEMLYPSELRAHWRHYLRFLRVFMMHLAVLLSILCGIEDSSARDLLFSSAFLMFMSPVALSHRRRTKAMDGRSRRPTNASRQDSKY